MIISDTVLSGTDAFSLDIFEHYKRRGGVDDLKTKKSDLNYLDIKKERKKETMVSKYTFFKNYKRKKGEIVQRYLYSALRHFYTDNFDPLGDSMNDELQKILSDSKNK